MHSAPAAPQPILPPPGLVQPGSPVAASATASTPLRRLRIVGAATKAQAVAPGPSPAAARPANQKRRIAVLRIAFALAALPLMLAVPVWDAASPAGAVLHLAGIFCIVAAVLGRFWAILYIGGRKNAEVMQHGPYSLCRHPLYLFSTIGVAGFGLLLGSLTLAAGLGVMGFAILSATAAREERFLTASFGAAYRDYAARVPRILPRIRPGSRQFSTPATMIFSVASLRGNLADAAVFLACLPVAEAIRLAHQAGMLRGFPLY